MKNVCINEVINDLDNSVDYSRDISKMDLFSKRIVDDRLLNGEFVIRF